MRHGKLLVACHASSLFLDKLSFFSYGIVANASNIVFEDTKVKLELKSLLAKLSSSRVLKYDMSEGSVQSSFDARLRISRLGR